MSSEYLLLFILMYCVSSQKLMISDWKNRCKSNADCRSNEHKECSLCANSNSGEPKCLFPFPYMFQSDNKNCERTRPCPIDCPADRGRCTQKTTTHIDYTPGCKCFKRFYGPKCQYTATANQKPINFVTWVFKGLIPVYTDVRLEFVFFSDLHSDFQSTKLVLDTGDGYFIRRTRWEELPGSCYSGSNMCTALPMKILFPYKMFSHTSTTKFITLKDRVIGYYANFSIVAIDLGKIIYDRQYQIVVSYKERVLKCIASIKLRNCSPSTETPTIFTRLTVIDFISELLYVTDGGYVSTSVANEKCSDGNIFKWRLWRYTGGEEIATPLFENYTNQAWRFNPYTLDIEMYKISFKVQNVRSLSSNFAHCYIKVMSLPLIIQVEGGSDRMIEKSSGLTLSAARSTDPNMPPTKQQDLFVVWSCKRIKPPTNYDPLCNPVTMNTAIPYFIPSELLMYSAVYNFTVKLWSRLYTNCDHCNVKPKLAFIRIQVGNETSNKSISINCVENCGDKVIPNESILLKVTSENVNMTSKFEWTYSNASVIMESLDTIKVQGMPSFMLLLKEGSLKSGTEYTITVRDYTEGAYAKYSFETDILSYDEACIVEPINGTRGLTEFDIICPLKDDYALLYEFYDKSNEDKTDSLSFNGRMIGTTSTGQIQNIRLTRGYVTIVIINSRGVSVKQEILVPLSDWNVTNEIISEIKKNLSDSLIHFGDEHGAIRLSSLLTDILPSKEDSYFKFLLSGLSKTSLDSFEKIKILSSTLYIVLTSFNKPIQFELHIDLLVNALDFIYKLTNGLRQFVFNRRSSQYTPSNIIREIAQIILQCFSIVLNCKVNKLVDIEHDELALKDITLFKSGSIIIENTIDHLKDALTFIQYSGKPPIQISTENKDIRIWTVTNDDNYPIENYLNKNYDIPVSIPVGLMTSFTKKKYKRFDLSLQTAYLNNSNFKWYKSDIKSNLVSVSLATRKDERDLTYIRSLQLPLTIHTTLDDNLLNMKLEGSVTQSDLNFNQDFMDMQVKIHRLDIKPRSRMTIVFMYPPTNGSLRVSVVEDYRPDFKHMIEHSMTISKKSAEYPHNYHEYDEPRFLYMGILPGKEVAVNQSVSYSFEVNTTLCQYWLRGSWKSDGCLVGLVTKEKKVSCQCTHLSTFGTAFLVPPQKVDPFGDAKLFLTVLDNPLVVALVTTFLLAYLLLCVYLCHMDRKDDIKKNVIILDDNFPFDNYPYLLAMFTSPRFNAGTTANVGVRLIGSEAESRGNILRSNERKVLKTGSDDWFLINCPKHLGEIHHLHLWHDNTGRSPSWFCENIQVYDLTNNTKTKFIVEQWLALCPMANGNEMNYPEARIFPTEVEDILSVKRNFLSNVVLGIRDGHRLMRVFYRHPRSQVTRVQRFSIIMLYIMVAMLCSIMFYKPTDETSVGVDDYQYSVGTKEFIISIQSLILSAVLTGMVLLAFKKSFQLNPYINRRRSVISYRQSQNKKSAYLNFVLFIASTMKNPPLDPVQLPNTPRLRLRKPWYILAWISCITIMLVCSYLVMLYGLKLGPVKSKKWLSSVILAVGEDALITGPAKIVLYAVGLSLAFQLMTDVYTHKIYINDIISERKSWKNSDVYKVLKKREQRMYFPLSIKARVKILKGKQIWSDWWTVLEFVVAIAIVVVICNVINILWSSNYYTNNHIRNMIADTKYPLLHSISFYNVSNVTMLEHYLMNNFINTIYNSRWYDRQTISERSFVEYNHWMSDFTNKLVGRPKIRQLRTKAVPCDNIVLQNGLCIPEWDENFEDTNVYSKRWKPATYTDLQKEDSYWVYKEQSFIFKPILGRFYGPSGRFFHDGGYSVTLGPSRLEAEQILDELQVDRWQDEKTRVVFVELTTLNGNKILFSQVSLMVEYLVTGIVLLRAQVISVSSIFNISLSSCLFVVFIVFHILKVSYLISYYGLLEFIRNSFHNITEIIYIIFGIVSIALFYIHHHTASQYTDELKKLEYDEYFEFDSFVQYFLLLKKSLSILLCVSVIRVIGSIYAKPLMSFFYTFTSSLRFIYWLAILIVLMYVVLKWWTFLLGITNFSLKELLINIKSLKYMMTQHIQNTAVKIFICLKMFAIYAINAVFLMILVQTTRYSKYQSTISKRLNSFVFIKSRFVGFYNNLMFR